MALGNLGSARMEDLRTIRLIPLVVRYSAGTPSVVQNPMGEVVTLTDNGVGDLSVTLATAGIAPLIATALVLPSAAGTLMQDVNHKVAATSSVVRLLVSNADDGVTDADPVDLHILIIKQVAA